MRAPSDLLVVGITGVGSALFLAQLLAIGQQIASANRHMQSELAVEKTAFLVNWMNSPPRPHVIDTHWTNPGCCSPIPHSFEPAPDMGRAVLNPTVMIRPEYPPRALDREVEGYVDFTFILEPDGSIADPKVLAEVPADYGFASAATKVFSRWRFDPFRENGKVLPTPAHYRMRFKLSD